MCPHFIFKLIFDKQLKTPLMICIWILLGFIGSCNHFMTCLNCFVILLNDYLQLFIVRIINWTVARQTPLSMEFSRQEYWSRLPFPSSGGLPDPLIEPRSPTLQADSWPSEPPGKPTMYWFVILELKPPIISTSCPTGNRIAAVRLLLGVMSD